MGFRINVSWDHNFMLEFKSSKGHELMTKSNCEAPTAKIKFLNVIEGINWNTVCEKLCDMYKLYAVHALSQGNKHKNI